MKRLAVPVLIVTTFYLPNPVQAWTPIKVPSVNLGGGPNLVSGAGLARGLSRLTKVDDVLDVFSPAGFIDDFVSPDGCTVIIGSVVTDGPLYADVNLNVTTGSVEVNCH